MDQEMENVAGTKVIRVAVTGPESTGKSRLAEELAIHFHTTWVPEYAREYLSTLQHHYTIEDIIAIAKGQKENEQQAVQHSRGLVFCDTDMLVTKIWAEHAFHQCPEWIEKSFTEDPYDFYLLCDVDIPWMQDPLREHPHLRSFFFSWYEKELIRAGFPYGVVSGSGHKRTANAINLLRNRFQEIHLPA